MGKIIDTNEDEGRDLPLSTKGKTERDLTRMNIRVEINQRGTAEGNQETHGIWESGKQIDLEKCRIRAG
jgi:hypothetical protein